MLDFGFSEIVLTSAIALIVLGPEKLPKVARQVGNWMGRARAMARQLTDQLEREVNAEEILRQSKPSGGASGSSRSTPPQALSDPNSTVDSAGLEAGSRAAGAAGTTYSADPAVPPHGADWHPAPPETKPSNE